MIFQGIAINWLTQSAIHIYALPYISRPVYKHIKKMLTNEYKPWAYVWRFTVVHTTVTSVLITEI